MGITRRFTLLPASAVLLALGFGCAQPADQKPAAPDLGTIESNIRSLDKDWAAAAAAKDLDKSTAFYADDAQMISAVAPAAVGKDAVRKTWAGLMSAPGFVSLTFEPTAVHVAAAGDMASELGTYEIDMKDKKGKPTAEKGAYVVVWKKQADGSWKVEVDSSGTGPSGS
ncbi:MAG: SgcJ/EcaC family oxidoreductase [Candidatus Acidiferrales bacterium]